MHNCVWYWWTCPNAFALWLCEKNVSYQFSKSRRGWQWITHVHLFCLKIRLCPLISMIIMIIENLNFALRLITNFYLSHYALKYWIVKQKITKVYRNHLVLYKNNIKSGSASDDLLLQAENCHKDLSLQKNDDDRILLQPFAKSFEIFQFLK